MRIRRRPPLALSSPQTTNFSLQNRRQRQEDEEEKGLHPYRDPSAVASSDPHDPVQVVPKEEKYSFSSSSSSSSPSSYKKALDTQLHSHERDGEETDKVASLVKENAGGDNLDEEIMNNGRKRKSPAVLMEGSRCSRVNGRGWRCSQQTLIGYSLCEHHLGKGRMRSVNSVRVAMNNASNGKHAKKEKNRSISSLIGRQAAGGSSDAVATTLGSNVA